MRISIFAFFALVCLGCGGPVSIPVAGTITLNDKPLADAHVSFFPVDDTPGQGGHGKTGPDGKYTITGTRGEKGLAPGEYKVAVSRRLRPDGSLPDPNTPPMDSDARETLLPVYADRLQTKLTTSVGQQATSHDFKVEAEKQR